MHCEKICLRGLYDNSNSQKMFMRPYLKNIYKFEKTSQLVDDGRNKYWLLNKDQAFVSTSIDVSKKLFVAGWS